MESAELKSKKRVRHCYPRKEVYHQWIHSPEYVYAANGSIISGKFNYLRCHNIGKFVTDGDIRDIWSYHKMFMLAVIDRDAKRICISRKFIWHNELVYQLPDNYEIFWCDDEIPTPDILTKDNEELLCKIHLKCVIGLYTEIYLREYYNILNGKLTLHQNIDDIANLQIKHQNYSFDEIKDFVKKYKVKSYSWYKESLNNKFKLQTYWPDSWDIRTIALPSVKQIVTKTVFTKKEKEYFRKRYFYTKYCRGRGIKFKDVEQYYNIPIDNNKARHFFTQRNIYWLDSYCDDSCITWNDFVIRSYEIDKKRIAKLIEDNKRKSDENYRKAKEKIKELGNCSVNDWREGKRIDKGFVEYEHFTPNYRKSANGIWSIQRLYINSTGFPNTQLKLVGNWVITSRNARVTLSDAIAAFKILKICIEKYKQFGKDEFYFADSKVGIFNLRDIRYTEKYKDYYNGNTGTLGYKTWLVRIGCHNLWLDDIEDFIHYYHLEDKFGLIDNKKNN